jgi:hypothetical protein
MSYDACARHRMPEYFRIQGRQIDYDIPISQGLIAFPGNVA